MPPSKPPTEVELKFLLLPNERSAVARNPLFGEATTKADLSSVYYDTPDRDLRKHGITLRVRSVQGSFVQTVKRDAGSSLFDRGEWEAEIQGLEPDPKAFAKTPAGDFLGVDGASRLTRLFCTEVRRTSRVVKDGLDLVEVSLDHGEVVAGTRHEPIDELELELKGGDARGLFRLARRFAGDAVLRLSFESKSERGYRLAAGEAPSARNAEAVHIGGNMTGAEAFAMIMRDCLAQICGNANLLRETRDSETLHQLRVGLRRLRAALATFEPILSGKEFARMAVESKWIGGELDTARDLDVFVANNAHTGKGQDESEGQLRVGDRLGAARCASYDRALEAIGSKRFAMFVLDCAEWVEVGDWRESRDRKAAGLRDGAASALAGAALDRLSDKLPEAGKHLGALDPAARHRARIKAKKLRYAAEFFATTFGHHAKTRRERFVASLARLQDALGDLNDLAVADRMLFDTAGDKALPRLGAERGVGERGRDQARLLKEAVHDYKDWLQANRFWRDHS